MWCSGGGDNGDGGGGGDYSLTHSLTHSLIDVSQSDPGV